MSPLIKVGREMFDLVTNYGKFAMFLILAVEETGVPLPIPGDLILLYAGFLISAGKMNFLEILLSSVLGVATGASLLFWVFRKGGRPFAHKYGKYIFLTKKRLTELDHWFDKHGDRAVLFGRFLPGLRVFLSAVAGLSDLKYSHFLPQILAASLAWASLFLGLGYVFGERWEGLAGTIQQYGYVFFLIFVAGIVIYWIKNAGQGKK